MLALMKVFACSLSALCFAAALNSCTNNSSVSSGPGTGPFDSRGNYVEAWADNPAKWRKPGSAAPEALPEVAQTEQPPMNANPLASTTSTVSTPVPKVDSLAPVKTTPKPTTAPKVVTTVKPKPKPQVVSKPKVKPKPKPAPKRYVVKSGDSLSAIASRNGTSVSALQRANGIKGSLIRPGQSLVIPK